MFKNITSPETKIPSRHLNIHGLDWTTYPFLFGGMLSFSGASVSGMFLVPTKRTFSRAVWKRRSRPFARGTFSVKDTTWRWCLPNVQRKVPFFKNSVGLWIIWYKNVAGCHCLSKNPKDIKKNLSLIRFMKKCLVSDLPKVSFAVFRGSSLSGIFFTSTRSRPDEGPSYGFNESYLILSNNSLWRIQSSV